MFRLKSPFWIFVISLTVVSFALAVQVGDPAPDFELVDTEGNTHTLNPYQDQVVFLNFFDYSRGICQSLGRTAETEINQVYQDEAFQALGIDNYNAPAARVETYRTATGVTYPLLTFGSDAADAYGADHRFLVIDTEGIIRYVSGEHQLDVSTIRETIDRYLPLDEPTFELEMREETIEYVNLTQDSSHWLFPYDFHGTITSLAESNINLVFTLSPMDPDTTEERRQYSICYSDFCYPPTDGDQSYTGEYSPGEVDTTVKFSIYWQVTGDAGFPVLADLVGDYLFDISVYDENNPEEAASYRLELSDVTGESVTIRPVPLANNHRLLSNYPNPFNPSTNISFIVERAGPVTLNVFDILGRNVAELLNSAMTAGAYTAMWDAKTNTGAALPSGSYWVRLNTASDSRMHRIVLIR